ncbi:cryptochrome/photolyase family protein [Streptomyces sp. NPDC004111]|uniref:cryptochrome/photolyase family protein n=1 Tax=Streptomyces sp. NPDC004111 TaxID=3364690 RepID=UPI00367AF47A
MSTSNNAGESRTTVVLFTSDLRVHDQPVLRAALRGGHEVVPLFVIDDGVRAAGFAAPNRQAFLADCLASLDAELRDRGGRLVVRTGDVVRETARVVADTGASAVHVAGGVSGYALRRERRLRTALAPYDCELAVHDAVITALPPGAETPSGSGSDHFAVFTPYHRRWAAAGTRPVVAAPRVVRVPEWVASDPLPSREKAGDLSPGLATGGEQVARKKFNSWLADASSGIQAYEDRHDDLPGDATSKLSPYFHFGCLSPVEAVQRAQQKGGAGAEAFVRQLAWRDFHHQVLAARPAASWSNYRERHDRWRSDAKEIEAWKAGLTGFPVVDAAMRQLAHEGWMHNRGRLLVASFLTKTLYVDWRVGARHFLSLLVDGDVANNQLNWQWAAGTGTDTRPNRILNPLAQAKRFDPHGDYVRRWVPELAEFEGSAVHQPWRLEGLERARFDYPDPIVDLAEARARFERARE